MATTIQNIELPKKPRARDTSGNNNHGEIYSGRGLEFDGVSDYLDTGYSDVGTIHTVACWIYADTTGDKHIFDTRDGASDGIRIMGVAGGKLEYQLNEDLASSLTSTVGWPLTWVRGVFTYDGTTQKIYVNGILNASSTISETINTTASAFIGARSFSSPTNFFPGMLADFQTWDTAWTQADVTYDYLNPESLALNASGSALTEGNLKLWYPMQDGHRGQQSYILDGANTGIVSAILDDDFSTNTIGNYGAANDGTAWDRGSLNYVADGFLRVIYTGTSAQALLGPAILTSGKNYKITFRAKGTHDAIFSSVGNNGEVGNAVSNPTLTTDWQDYEFFITANGSNLRFYQVGSADADQTLDIDNILVQPINDKHHATTVFYGDELVTNGDCEVTDPATVTINSVAFTLDDAAYDDSTEQANGGSKSLKITADSSSVKPEVKFLSGDAMGLIVGRTYKYSMDVYLPAGLAMDQVRLKVMDNSGSQVGESYTTTTGSWVALSITFVNDDITSLRVFGYNGGLAVNNESYYIDNVSVKEVGVASGWTDADQQLHIPQTALQSYNELAWFDGVADHAVVSDHNDLSFDPMSISAWINMNDATDFPIIGKGAYNSTAEYQLKVQSDDKIHFWVADESVDSCHIGRKTPTVTTQEKKWIHVVGTYSGGTASSGLKIYINGVQSDDANDEAAAASFEAMENLTADVYIGRYSNTYANGCITETSLWDKELSSTEVLELFNDGKALDALTHSASSDIKGYWRNNGLSTWTDLKGSNNGTPTSVTETILIPEGVDTTRDSQGFLMNKKRSTGSLNFPSRPQSSTEVPDFGDLDFGTGDFSMECWVQYGFINNSAFGESASGLNVVLSTGSASSSNSEGINLLSTSGDFKFRIGDGDKEDSLDIDPDPLTVGNWYHIVVTREGTALIAYVDGDANNNMTITSGINVSRSEPLRIGNDRLESRTYKWPIDAVKFYNKALDETEVTKNYKATKGSHEN